MPLTEYVAGGTPESQRDAQPNAVSNALTRGLALVGPTACLRLKFGGYLALPCSHPRSQSPVGSKKIVLP